MKITALETIRLEEYPTSFVEVHTTEGLDRPRRDVLCPGHRRDLCPRGAGAVLLGRDPLPSTESRTSPAIWEFARRGRKCAQLPRSTSRCGICSARSPDSRSRSCWAASPGRNPHLQHLRRDRLHAREPGGGRPIGDGRPTPALRRPQRIPRPRRRTGGGSAREGLTAMKIWPFDLAAEANDGAISPARGTEGARSIHSRRSASAVGDRMEIMVEFHSLWQLLPAIGIAKALAPFETFWHEDPIRIESLGEPQALRRSVAGADMRVRDARPRAGAFATSSRPARPASSCSMSPGAAASRRRRKIASMAEAWHLPVAPHDCTGPVVLAPRPIFAERAQRAGPGERARLLPHLVSRSRRPRCRK